MARWSVGMVLLASGVILSLGMGIRQSFGLFLPPVVQDLQWSATGFAFAIALQQLIWGVSQPFCGMLADRFGSGRVLAAGGGCYIAGLAMMGLVPSSAAFSLGSSLFVGLGISAAGFPIVLGAVSRLVPPARRSLALGLATAGGSFGQFALAPFGQTLIGGLGWQGALLAFAAMALLILPSSAVLAGRSDASHAAGSAASLTSAIREASRHPTFWYVTAGFFVCGFHVAFIATHLPGVIATCMLSPMVGATALGLIGLFNMVGSFLAGAAGGRYRQKYLLSGIYFARAAAILAFLLAPKTEAVVLAFGSAMGLLWLSTVPLTSGLVARIYGPRYVATLFGIVFLSHQVGAFFGAWLGGWAFDRTGSYDIVWIISIGLAVMAGLINLPVADRSLRPTAA